ncbi:MAG: fasciclin domain-containing protein [Bacteroidota bacterium]
MRNVSFYRNGFLALLFFCWLAGCNKTPAPTKNPITPLQELVNTDTTLSLFHRMVLQANEAGLLGNDSVTLLLPTNAAFRSAGYSEAIIDSLSAAFADRMVRYHFIRSRIIPDGAVYTGYSTFLGYNVYGMTDGNQVRWFNGTTVTGDSAMVGNVLVYRLSTPLASPADSLDILLGSDSTLSFMAEVLRRTNLDSVVSSGAYTLLAPVNSAFINAGYDSVGAIDLADSATLVQLVKYHTLTGTFFTNTLMGLTTVPTLLGSSVTVSQSSGVLQFAGPGNSIPASWLSGNQPAGNAPIVQRIDQVLSP